MNKVIPKFNKMSEEDKANLIQLLVDYKPALEDALEDLENALTTEDNEQLLEVIDTLQHDFAHGNMCASWYQEHLEKLLRFQISITVKNILKNKIEYQENLRNN